MIENWVKDLTESVVGGAPVEVGRRYVHETDGLVEITSGQYWGKHGVSNFWYWTVVETGEKKHGYGIGFISVEEAGTVSPWPGEHGTPDASETVLAEVMTEVAIAELEDEDVPAAIIAGLRERGYVIADANLKVRGSGGRDPDYTLGDIANMTGGSA